MGFKNKTVLITGGSGSWGNTLTRHLLDKDVKKIIIFSRGELAQVNMERKFRNPKIEFVIGDIRDRNAVDRVFSRGIDYVFHLAALKHVPVCENMPIEAIQTNINGTINLIDAAIKYKVEYFIDVSSDKAVAPVNLYGMTKAVGEKLTIQANNLTKDTRFVCIRGGNVLGSNGSVVPFFIDQIKTKNKVTITSEQMTRFFLTLDTAIELLFEAVEYSVGGEIFVMNMPSFLIRDLADVLVSHYGNNETQIENIGIREGEKLHEQLISDQESPMSYWINEDYYVILPSIHIDRDYDYVHKMGHKLDLLHFSSDQNLKPTNYLYKLLMQGGFLK